MSIFLGDDYINRYFRRTFGSIDHPLMGISSSKSGISSNFILTVIQINQLNKLDIINYLDGLNNPADSSIPGIPSISTLVASPVKARNDQI